MLSIAVVEDDPDHRRTLVGYLHDFLAGREAYTCAVFEDGADFLANPPAQLDLVFLDIVMGRSNGMEVARRLRERDGGVAVVFVTEAVQYALEGYAVDAADFLVKPLYYTSFCTTMQRVLAARARRAPTLVEVRYDKGATLVDAGTLTYAETRRKGTAIHTLAAELPCADSLRSLEQRLAPHGFSRCHQAYLVNLAFVEGVRKDEVVVCGTALPLSRHRREAFVADLIRVVGEAV